MNAALWLLLFKGASTPVVVGAVYTLDLQTETVWTLDLGMSLNFTLDIPSEATFTDERQVNYGTW